MRSIVIIIIGLVAAGAGHAVRAQEAAARGEAIARTWCARCHAVAVPGQASAIADAPSFAAIGAEPGFGRARLANALLAPHPVMPQFPLSSADLDALETYIATLAAASALAGAQEGAD